jgi:hypothetical protein
MSDMSNFPTAAAGIDWAQNARINRRAIADAIERLVSILDEIDGDPDIEEDDWPGDPLDQGELDGTRGVMLPRYDIDQTKGPINEAEAVREHRRREMEAGWREHDLLAWRRKQA